MKNKKYFCRHPYYDTPAAPFADPIIAVEKKDFKEIKNTSYKGVWVGVYEEEHPHNGDSFDCTELLFDSIERLDWYYSLLAVKELEGDLKEAQKKLNKNEKKLMKKHGDWCEKN